MRRIGDLMKEMGFNKDAPLETQKAFIRHLIQAANGAAPVSENSKQNLKPVSEGEQLSFDPDILGTQIFKKTRVAR